MSRTLSGLVMGDTDLTINVQLSDLSADNITSGLLDDARIPNLQDLSGTLTLSQIPDIPTSKITGDLPVSQLSGTLTVSQLPDIPASKITDPIRGNQIEDLSGTYVNKSTFKALVAASTDFADFKSRMANF